jgi:anti-anti-sigma regulatory factor
LADYLQAYVAVTATDHNLLHATEGGTRMTVTASGPESNSPFRYGNPTVECDGAQLRAQCRQLATVVSISGCIDDSNVDGLIDRVGHYVLTEKPVILDLSDIRSFAARGAALLESIDDLCDSAGVEWSLVANQSVLRALRLRGDQSIYPTADSVSEALHHFSDVMSERRRLLPLLGKSA